MNHQERIELLKILVQAGVSHYKSHDLEISFGKQGAALPFVGPPLPATPPIQNNPPIQENVDATEKLKGLIETLKMDDATLIDKIFPAGAGG